MRLNIARCVENIKDIKEFVNWIIKIEDRDMNLSENGGGIVPIL